MSSALILSFARIALALFALTIAGVASALDTGVPAAGLPSASQFSATLVPEREGIVSWRTLAKVEPVKQNGRMVPSFGQEILALDKKEARVQGFMIPLDVGDKQKRFLLASVPADCPFCLPAGPDAIVEINAKAPVRYTFEPIIMAGHFAVLKDEASGLLYRLTDATQVESAGPAKPR
jgi:uncharacterized protein